MQQIGNQGGYGSAETRAMDVRRMFSSMLQSWAVDVLSLRSRGLDRPSMREGLGQAEAQRRRVRKAA